MLARAVVPAVEEAVAGVNKLVVVLKVVQARLEVEPVVLVEKVVAAVTKSIIQFLFSKKNNSRT